MRLHLKELLILATTSGYSTAEMKFAFGFTVNSNSPTNHGTRFLSKKLRLSPHYCLVGANNDVEKKMEPLQE